MNREQSLLQLEDLEGRRLSAVVFVQDYLQLQFDGTRLTATTWPIVTGAGGMRFGDVGYRDALCALIGKTVLTARVVPSQSMVCTFDGGRELFFSLVDEDRHDPELIRLEQEDGTWYVW